ncbi:NUMOD4 domain-containing protein [Leminorella grimontii]|uniref:NUMOD4 domain-containing protein n=1 Tax=Leminorella grimontii TaxID=82981 RepID=UPI0020827351|nr:NUMOD4 domain-containing protein [Leminorella grimontii]GKX60180.1 hypothetical protein SOASR031_24950 [Leminorella grimontii]
MNYVPVVGWEGLYEVSRCGSVRSIDRTIVRADGSKQSFKGRELKHFSNSKGYSVVRLSDDSHGRRMIAMVHRLVAEAFIPNPDKKPEVNHIDGVKSNPNACNLEWVTPKENRKHAWNTGLRNRTHLPLHRGEQKANSKLTDKDVMEIRRLRSQGLSYIKLAKKFSVSKKTAMFAAKGLSWSHVPLPQPPTD